jgi:hypothetical protein
MFAAGSRHDISFVPETTFGTTPGTPTMTRLRNTGTSLNLPKETFTSDEIRADRMITDLRHGNRRVTGDVTFELSYGAFDTFLEAALMGTWATNVLKAGTTFRSFTLERRFTDIGKYIRYLGAAVNTLAMTIAPGKMVTGSMGFLGKDINIASSSLGTPAAGPANPPFDAYSGTMEEGGAAIGSLTSLTLNLDNGLDPAFVIGSPSVQQVVTGRSNLTGRASLYFENETMYNKFINETESSIHLVLNGAAPAGDLDLLLPRIKYTGADLPLRGEGLIAIDMPFQALYDSTTGTNLQITRIP